MKIGVVVQARMSSARLPGKVLRELAGRPLLAHVLDRVRQVGNADVVVLATSTEASDDPVAELGDSSALPSTAGRSTTSPGASSARSTSTASTRACASAPTAR
ncbi:MAG: hypothetical protein R3C15_10325 [Thermoleophilia bacterium]